MVGLSLTLGFIVFELIGFLSGTSMFMHTQGMICILFTGISIIKYKLFRIKKQAINMLMQVAIIILVIVHYIEANFNLT